MENESHRDLRSSLKDLVLIISWLSVASVHHTSKGLNKGYQLNSTTPTNPDLNPLIGLTYYIK